MQRVAVAMAKIADATLRTRLGFCVPREVLQQPPASAACRHALIGLLALLTVEADARPLPASAQPAEVQSRELVDIEIAADGTVLILLSAPDTPTPGLLRWTANAAAPSQHCTMVGRTAFSFDRQRILEFTGTHDGIQPSLRVRRADTCKITREIVTREVVVDADVRGDEAVIATHDASGEGRALSALDRQGRIVASVSVGRNIDIGITPNGRAVANFDPSDGPPSLWRLPSLQRVMWPAWAQGRGPLFLPAALIVGHVEGDLTVLVRWPDGAPLSSSRLPPDARLHRVSADARFALITQRGRGQERLLLHDFLRHRSATLFEGLPGSVDHASMSRDGRWIAWSVRDSVREQSVRVHRQPTSAADFRP